MHGVRTPLERRGYSGGNDTYTFTFESARAIPARAGLLIEIHDGVQTYQAPFRLENLPVPALPDPGA